MKIDIAIHSSDSNPYYLDFWPLVSRVWKQVFGIEPLLLYIDDNHDISIDETYGRVIKLKPVPNVPVYFQCLWIRYWYPTQVPNKVCMISDIDMFPLSRRYFIDQIASIDDSKYVHLNPNHYPMPSCYHIARGSTFKQVLCLHDDWETSVNDIYTKNLGHDCFDGTNEILKGKIQWGADEKYATDCIRSYPDQSIFVFVSRTQHRIDRSHWVYDPKDIRRGLYADSHSIRPYSMYKREVDTLIEDIYKNCL